MGSRYQPPASRGPGDSSARGPGSLGGAQPRRFPQQNVLYRPGSYRPTDEELRRAEEGGLVIIRGRVIASVEWICRVLGGSEGMWYYFGRQESPVIEGLYIPVQDVSAAHCRVSAIEVIRAGREIRRRGFVVLAAGHSHGYAPIFTSNTDLEQEEILIAEQVARASTVEERVAGTVTREPEPDVDGFDRVRAEFADTGLSIELSVPAGQDGIAVDLIASRRKSVSSFSTSSYRGVHLFPGYESIVCPLCRAAETRQVPPREIDVLVLGPVAISRRISERIQQELDDKVTRVWRYGYGSTSSTTHDSKAEPATVSTKHDPERDAATAASADDTAEEPAPFTVTRRGWPVGKVSAAVMEQAAWKCLELRQALGWEEESAKAPADGERADGERADGDGHGGTNG